MQALPTSVLFCCTYNAVRSPMAEAILKSLHPRRIYVDSCGIREGELDPFIVAAMDEIGIDISRHRPKLFDNLEDESHDMVVTLSPEAHHRALELTRTIACDVVYWPTLDPSITEGTREMRLDAYRTVRDQLYDRILKTFPVSGGPAP
jgi:protein-tyrosine phosphatase